jgi:uncharacterized protein (DUF362 family)
MSTLSRREVLRLGGRAAAGLGATHLLGACGGENPVAHPPTAPSSSEDAGLTICQGTVVEPSARVAAARGFDLYAMTREVLDLLGGLQTVVGEGESVFIKPNMVTLPWAHDTQDPFGGGECTKAEILIAVAEECLRVGASEVVIGDGSQMPRFDWSRATTLDRSTHLAREAERLSAQYQRDVRLACLEVDTPRWVDVPTGISLGSVAVSSLVLDADRVISVPVAKTHASAHLTLSLKNFIGITPLQRYGWMSQNNYDRIDLHRNDPTPADFGRLYIDLANAARPDLTIVDFSIGMEGNGPTSGNGGTAVDMRSRLGSWLLLASTDPVAADATAARVMSHEAVYVGRILPMAQQAGLGAICPQSIELIGAEYEDLQVVWRPAQIAQSSRMTRRIGCFG